MKEAYRDQGTVPFVEHTVQDIRLALRQLAKSPGLAATAILVLALGMGGCLAVFGFVEAALLRPLPYAEPDAAGRRDGDATRRSRARTCRIRTSATGRR